VEEVEQPVLTATPDESDCGATAEEQQVLSQYVGWGGLADAFDPSKENWSAEYPEAQTYHPLCSGLRAA